MKKIILAIIITLSINAEIKINQGELANKMATSVKNILGNSFKIVSGDANLTKKTQQAKNDRETWLIKNHENYKIKCVKDRERLLSLFHENIKLKNENIKLKRLIKKHNIKDTNRQTNNKNSKEYKEAQYQKAKARLMRELKEQGID